MSNSFRGGFRHDMDKDLGIDVLEEVVRQDDEGKWDALIPLQEVSFEDGRKIRTPDGVFEMTDHALWQFYSRLGIPVNYATKCPPAIMQSHVDYWLDHYTNNTRRVNNWLIRGKGDQVRAVLTDNYSIFDNRHIVQSIKEASLHSDFNVASVDVSDESFHVRLVSPKVSNNFGGDNGSSDVFWGGIHLSNKEIGGASAKAEFLLFRLICSNGLVGINRGRTFRRVHRGFTMDMISAFVDELAGVVASYEGGVRDAFTQLEKARGEYTERGVDLTHYIAMELGLGKERADAAAHFAVDDMARYDIVNAMSEGAHNFSGDERYEMEAAAGSLLWRSIVPFEMEMERKEREKEEKEAAALI